MVAIVSGNGLGLFNSSLNQLGKRGVQGNASFGQARIEDYINIAEGNLVIRQQGYNLAATGQDIQSVLTYNSKGLLNNNAQWEGSLISVKQADGNFLTDIKLSQIKTVR